jgi:hypothetical protein
MPFDYNEFSQDVAKAREAKVSDDDILSHLASIDQGFKDAKENGYNLNEIDSFLKEKYKTKGGDKNDAYQTSQDQQGGSGDSNEQGMQTIPIKASSSQGVQANDQPSSQDQQVVQGSQQANLNIKTALTGDSQFGIGGEPLERQEQMSVGSGYKGPQAEVQQAIPSEGKAGEQAEVAPKPAPFPTVRSQGEDASIISRLVNMPTRGLAEGVYNVGAAISDADASYGPNILMAKAADSLFGTNSFSDELKQNPVKAAETFRKWASPMKMTPTEASSTFNGVIYGVGKLIPDLILAALTEGASGEPALAKAISETSIWKSIAEKSMHGIKSFALPSVIASQESITDAKRNGKSDADALKDGIKTLVSTEAGAVLPLGVTSKLDTMLGRAASKFVQAYGLVTAQNEIATMANNIGVEQSQRQLTLTENIITGKFGDAVKQAAGAVPMALLGILGGADEFTPGVGKKRKDLEGVTDILNQLNLPETAETFKEIKTEEKPAPKFATRDTIIYNANKRYEELTKKRDAGEAFTDQEKEELAVLEKVPTVEELAAHYEITIQEPKKKPAKAKAKAQPEKPNEEQVKKTSGVSPEQGKPSVEAPAVKAEEGTPQREGEGKEEVVKTPEQKAEEMTSFAEASTPEEVDAFLAKTLKDFEAVESISTTSIKSKNALLNQARKQALARKKEIKSEATKKAKEEASKPKPSKEPVMEAPAPEPEPIPEEAPKEQGEPKARKPRKEKPSEPMGTRVLSAAFRPNKGKNKGKVFYGASHKQAMLKSGMSWMEIQKDYAHPEQREDLEFGYKTDTNPFVSRDKGEQVARLSGQADVEKLDADKALGYKMHSNHLSLDDHPETAGQGQKFGPGAMKKAEKGVPFGEKDHNADLVKSAQIHKDLVKGEFKGGTNYSTWSKAFEKAFPDAKNYSEDERFNLFKQGESLAAHSEFFEKDLDLAVSHPKLWEGKTVPEIKIEAISRDTKDINGTNEQIDKSRVARGLNPVMREAAVTCGEAWDEAMQLINSRQGYAASFIEGLKRNPRPLTPVENALLRHSVIEALNAVDSADAKIEIETDPRLIESHKREYDDAKRKYAELSEINYRTNSASGSSLQFLKLIVKSDFSLPRLISRAISAKKMGGNFKGKVELTEEEKTNLTNLSIEIEKTEKQYYDALEKTKLKENMRGLIEYLEFSRSLISEAEGEKKSPKDEVQRFTTMLKNNKQDPITLGLAMRGMARNLSELLKTKDPNKLADEVHDRISRFMGDAWEKSQTLDALNGSGAFHQKSEQGLRESIGRNNDKTFVFQDEFRKALKIKNPKEKQKRFTKLIERFSVEVHNLDSQIRNHLEDVGIEADRIIGELDNDLLSCE